MASISKDPNGRKRIQFIDAGKKRKTVRLGKTSMRYAESVKVKVEDLVAASITGHAPTDETSRWLASLNDKMFEKLARVGLTQRRQSAKLKDLLDRYLNDRKGELKPESARKLRQTNKKLLAHFDAETPLRSITTQQAADWRSYLKDLKLSDASIKTHCGNAKTMLAEGVRHKLIDENPFQYLKSGPTPSKYSRYVTPDEIEKIIDVCADCEWKLLFGLARYAGLRIPSESQILTWADVDFDLKRLTVRSPKTERHTGHEQRIIPITPKLMILLQNRFDECEEGEELLITINGKGALIRKVRDIWKRACVEPWERLWQTLRQSCEKEWAMTFPQYAVSKWIGHSITVSGRHYANAVPHELFEKAAQNTAQKLHETGRKSPKSKQHRQTQNANNPANCEDLRRSSSNFKQLGKWSRGESNPRAETVSKPRLHV